MKANRMSVNGQNQTKGKKHSNINIGMIIFFNHTDLYRHLCFYLSWQRKNIRCGGSARKNRG